MLQYDESKPEAFEMHKNALVSLHSFCVTYYFSLVLLFHGHFFFLFCKFDHCLYLILV